jgi:ADP-heptose:LPS heptosyltransferase
MRIALSGAGAHEEDLCASVERALGAPGEERCLGRSLADLAGLLKRSDLVVCGNTGVMHLAAGLGRPLVALHGPTSPTIWGPRADAVGAVAEVLSPETDCAPCLTLGFEYGCAGRACMDSIAVDVVERACVKILGVGRG